MVSWEVTTKDYAFLADQQDSDDLRQAQLAQPGVMVFRSRLKAAADPSHPSYASPYKGGLIVFVVGEKPTGGMNDDQFNNALAWIARLHGISTKDPLRILGPVFSGSLPSLRRDLENALADPALLKDYEGDLHASSGTVSSFEAYKMFKSWISEHWPNRAKAGEESGSFFRTAIENDSLITDRFCQYLIDQHYAVGNIAFLSEDETAFGGVASNTSTTPNAPSPCRGAVRLYYPRDIAHAPLRL